VDASSFGCVVILSVYLMLNFVNFLTKCIFIVNYLLLDVLTKFRCKLPEDDNAETCGSLLIERKRRSYKCAFVSTGLFKMIVRVLTTCHTQYTWDSSM
jgi:hypothetical protein